jgi:hypothetical protein
VRGSSSSRAGSVQLAAAAGSCMSHVLGGLAITFLFEWSLLGICCSDGSCCLKSICLMFIVRRSLCEWCGYAYEHIRPDDDYMVQQRQRHQHFSRVKVCSQADESAGCGPTMHTLPLPRAHAQALFSRLKSLCRKQRNRRAVFQPCTHTRCPVPSRRRSSARRPTGRRCPQWTPRKCPASPRPPPSRHERGAKQQSYRCRAEPPPPDAAPLPLPPCMPLRVNVGHKLPG